MPCLDENAAVELVLGDGDADEATRRRAHVARCESCRRLVAGVARVVLSASRSDDEGWLDAAEPLAPGTRVGSYTVLGVIGRGGMGVVHAARDDRLRRNVALKLLRADAYDDAAVARLRREAQLLARLCHPNVVTVHDVGMCERGPFVAIELVEGMDLRRWLAASPRGIAEIVHVFREAGRGLAAAHEAGLVHRDFKPANVLVGSDGRVVVADFGLATPSVDASAKAGEASEESHATDTSITRAFVGTPAYMAPEQLRSEPADARADQFSFCVALFEAVHGVRPFAGAAAPPLLEAMRAGVRPPRRRVRSQLAAAIQRGLAFEASARFESMAPLLAALHERPLRTRGLVVAAAAAAVIVGVAWPRSTQGRCEDRADWNGERRAEVERALTTGSGPPASSVLARIDAYAQSWSDAYAQACGVDDMATDRSMACLRARKAELSGIVDAVTDADDRGRADLHTAVAHLAPPSDCLDTDFLALRFSAEDPSLQAELSELTSQAERARATRSPELDAVLLPALADLRRRAEDADQPGLAAEALRLQAIMAVFREDYAAAERLYEEAFFLAQLAGDRRLAFDVAMQSSLVLGGILAELDRARVWNERGRALVDAVSDPKRRADLAIREADLLLAVDDNEAALEVLAAAEPRAPADVADLWPAFLDKRARAKMGTHDTRGAADDWTLALQTIENELGPEHPEVLGPLNGLAIIHIMLDEKQAAAAYLERALGVEDESLGSRRAYLLGNLAMLHEEMGELGSAVDELLEADKIFEQHLGVAHPMTVKNAINLARIHAALGRWPDVERYAARARPHVQEGPDLTALEAILATAP